MENKNNTNNKVKNNNITSEQQQERLKQSIKKRTLTGVDRGLKFSWKEYQEQSSFYKKLLFVSLGANAMLATTIMFFQSTTTFFILDSEQKPIKLEQLSKLPLTETRVISFVDESVTQIFSLNYRFVDKQVKLWTKYFEGETYKKFIQEMDNSNYIPLLQKNKAIMTVIPTPTIYKIKVIGPDSIEIIRSFAREDISKNVIETEETVYKIIIKRVIPSEQNPWGFVILELKEDNIQDYLPKTTK